MLGDQSSDKRLCHGQSWVLSGQEIARLKDLCLVLWDSFSYWFERRVDLLAEWLINYLGWADKFIEKPLITQPEWEVVLDRSDLMELAELGKALMDLFVARVCLKNAKRQQDSSCALKLMKLLNDFINLIES